MNEREYVVFAVKPKYAFLIYAGKKRYELRRVIPKRLKKGDSVIIYESDKKKITGFFTAGEIISASVTRLWEKVSTSAGVSKRVFLDYFAGKGMGYAIGIENPTQLKEPIPLMKMPEMLGCAIHPPQNFCYIEPLISIEEIANR